MARPKVATVATVAGVVLAAAAVVNLFIGRFDRIDDSIDELRTDIASLRTETTADIANLRAEIAADIASLRAEIATNIASLRAEVAEDRRAVSTLVSLLTSNTEAAPGDIRHLVEALGPAPDK